MGSPSSAAAISCEHDEITRVSCRAVFSAIAGRSSPSGVPEGTSGGNRAGGRSTASSSRWDHSPVTGFQSCVLLAMEISARGTPPSR